MPETLPNGIVLPDITPERDLWGDMVNDDLRLLDTHLAATSHIRVSEPVPILHVTPTGDDAFDGRWDRPKLTIQAAIDALGTNATHRAGRILTKGKYLLTAPILVDRRTAHIEGTGWEIKNGTSRGTLLEWGGAAGQPMIQFLGGNWGGGISKMHVLGNPDPLNRPSAAISLLRDASEPAPNSLLRFEDLFIGPMAGYDGTESSSDYFDNGVLAEGTDTNNDMSVWDNLYIRRAATGVKLTGTQNVGHNFRDMRIVRCGVGFDSVSRVMGQNWYFLYSRDEDIWVHGGGYLAAFRVASELGHRMARLGEPSANEAGHLVIIGGQWQRNETYMDPSGLIVDGESNGRTSLELRNFEFTSIGAPPLPIIRLKSEPGGASEHRLVAKGVSSIDPTWIDMAITQSGNSADKRHIEIERWTAADSLYMLNILQGGGGQTVVDPARRDIPPDAAVLATHPTAGTIKSGKGATAARPAAATVGQGAQWFDSTLQKPIWSDGTNWRDATGTVV